MVGDIRSAPEQGTEATRAADELQQRILQLEAELHELMIERDSIARENEFNRTRLVAVRESSSWRLTRPVRGLSRLLGRIARKRKE